MITQFWYVGYGPTLDRDSVEGTGTGAPSMYVLSLVHTPQLN